jgi:AcrR family transcriptional regulator
MPRAGLSTAAVVDAALAVVDEHGLDALTLASVASRTGVAAPSLYKHVRSRDALQQKLSAVATAEMADALSAAAAGRARADALRAVADAYREYALDHPGRYPATQQVPDPTDPFHVTAGERAVHAVYAVLRGYHIGGDDAVDATRMLRSALHGFVSLEISGGFGVPQDIDRSFDRLLTSLDAALDAWPTPAQT